MEEVELLIESITKQFDTISNNFKKKPNYFPLNMKKKRVEDVYKDETLLLYVFNYRSFINDNVSNITNYLQKNKFNNVISTRVKALNSIQYKIQSYEMKEEKGKVALKKCLNDIYGIRMILEEDIDYKNIQKYIKKKFPKLKCILANRGEYKAVHIYFGNDDNTLFQWELQLWDKKHEKTNLDSHAKYKQDYIKWEQNNVQEVEL